MARHITANEARAAYSPKLRRDLAQEDVTCPAGTEVGGCRVHCGIERRVVSAEHEPTSLLLWCCGSYVDCPTWRAAKHATWAQRHKHFVREIEGR